MMVRYRLVLTICGIPVCFLVHIEHSPRRTLFWDLKQVSVNFKGLEKYML